MIRTTVVAICLAGCGSTGFGPEPDPPVEPVAPAAAATDAAPALVPLDPIQGWTWRAVMTGPWRVPADLVGSGWALAIADRDHAVLGTVGNQLLVIDLGTGDVSLPTPVVPRAVTIDGLGRIGGRVVAFGSRSSWRPLAWTISLGPLTATPLRIPDGGTDDPSTLYASILESPDGQRVLTCSYGRWPTLRDARTLAVIRELVGTDCMDPQFTDADHLHFATRTGWRSVDATSGAVVDHAASEPRAFVGPGGRSVELTPSAFPAGPHMHRLMWAPDGTAVEVMPGVLVLHPAGGGPPRPIGLPSGLFNSEPPLLAVGEGKAVVVVDYDIVMVDLDDAEVHHADGSLGVVHHVAPRAGSAVITADEIREYRAGRELHAGGPASRVAADPTDQPVAAVTDGAVIEWDPATGKVREVAPVTGEVQALSRAGDIAVFAAGGAVMRAPRGQPATRWFRFPAGLTVEAIDASTDRVIWSDKRVYRVADVARGDVWTLAVTYADECRTGGDVRLGRGTSLFAIETDAGFEWFDLATRTRLGGARLVDFTMAWDLVPGTREILIATDRGVLIWELGAPTARVWNPGLGGRAAVDLAIDATGTEVAIAYVDGSIVWATLDGLRANGASRRVDFQRPHAPRCDRRGGGPGRTAFGDLVLDLAAEPAP